MKNQVKSKIYAVHAYKKVEGLFFFIALITPIFFLASCQKEINETIAESPISESASASRIEISSAAPINTYYVSPNGNDNNAGTISSPWFSLNRAWQTIQAGDLIYLRGGTYAYSSQIQGYCVGKNGTATNPIRVWAYPGEVPVITKTNSYQNNQQHWRGGVYFEGNYTHWKGITFTGFKLDDTGNPFIWRGFYAEKANFNIFERFVSYGNECGFSLQDDSKGNLMLNIDTYNNFHLASGGGHADGFSVGYITAIDAANPNVVKGCRSWNNGDDGFDTWMNHGFIEFDSCWSWHNGYNYQNGQPAGDGNGYKLGRTDISSSQFRRVLKNCIAYDNKERGFDKNDVQFAIQAFNCVAYNNGGTGFALDNSNGNVFRNNFALNNGNGNTNILYTSSSNNACGGGSNCSNWGVTVSANDIYTDATGISGARQADGTLPNISFLHLKPTATHLINTGMNVGIPFSGSAPDIGAFETGTVTPPPPTNQPPTANAGQNITIILPVNTVTLSGSGSDPDGTIVSYSWSKVSGPSAFSIASPLQAQTAINNLVQGTYDFRLTVTDNQGATATDQVRVTVNNGTPPPPTTGLPLNISQVSLDAGFAYYLPQDFGIPGDDGSNPNRSTLRIFENGIELNPAHTSHADIRSQGRGRFSHWSNGSFAALWFSTSDNSDPRTNGRTYTYIAGSTTPPPGNTPYGGTPRMIPGIIQAEDYDNGGQNIAYYDRTTGNAGNRYRTNESADVGMSNKELNPYLGWTQSGEWLKYTVNITTSRAYTLQLRVASASAGKSVRIEIDGTTVATVSIPNTGGGQKWVTVTVPNINLSAGTKVMRLYNVTGGQNINYIQFQ